MHLILGDGKGGFPMDCKHSAWMNNKPLTTRKSLMDIKSSIDHEPLRSICAGIKMSLIYLKRNAFPHVGRDGWETGGDCGVGV